jgi:release factor glutamine methyltransferase
MSTVHEALRRGGRQLVQAGILNGSWDAELLLRHVTGWDRARLLTSQDEPLSDEAQARFERLVDGRARRRPLQHLVGSQAFWRQELLVDGRVLIPRPDTEILVERALAELREVERPIVVDVGTGSGCIAIALASERPDAQVHAVDISPDALDLARENARRTGLLERIRFHEGDQLAPLRDLFGQLDAVVANPPYVDPADEPTLAPEVAEHEPRLALFDRDGHYGAYARLAPQALAALRPGGWLLVEIGAGMQAGVAGLLRDAGLELGEASRDLNGHVRLVAARRGLA